MADPPSTATLGYNVALLGVDAAALAAIGHRPTIRTAIWCGLAVFCVAAVLAPVLGSEMFEVLALYTQAVFVHGVFVLLGVAVLLRREARAVSLCLAALAVATAAVGVDAFVVEPDWLEVTHTVVRSSKVSRPVRLAVVADLQADHVGAYERRVLRRVMEERADVILLLGDYLQVWDAETRARLRSELHDVLREVSFGAPLGIVAVGGNVDAPDWPMIFGGLPVTVVEEARTIDAGELRITALAMRDSAKTTLHVAAERPFHVAIGHFPDFALGDVQADLLLAGHTHGGQVRLPFIGPLMTLSHVPRAWAAGVTTLSEGRILIVSRGIGMERLHAPRLRFLCRPELVVVDVVPQ